MTMIQNLKLGNHLNVNNSSKNGNNNVTIKQEFSSPNIR